MISKLNILCLCAFVMFGCSSKTINSKNERQGKLKASMALFENGEKKFVLDDNTAPKPEYTSLFNSPDGKLYFTFINGYNNSVYFYDYHNANFEKKISWAKTGPNSVRGIKGYLIKNLDSIYLFSKASMEIILSGENGNIQKKISLLGNTRDRNFFFRYPQYFLQTVVPFIETPHELLLTGFFFGAIPDSIIANFKFTARLNFQTNKVKFSHTYPRSLYGFNSNWGSEFMTEVYSTLHPDGSKLILSFPVSHDLYLVDLKTGENKKVYAGSNYAGTICSLDKDFKSVSNEELAFHFNTNDLYAAILYDKYRKLYYRFLLKAMPNATIHTDYKEKPISIIVMDEKFNYLGETTIGTWKNWNWPNSFVTSEGLNMEYTGDDAEEKYLTLKIFQTKKI